MAVLLVITMNTGRRLPPGHVWMDEGLGGGGKRPPPSIACPQSSVCEMSATPRFVQNCSECMPWHE